jgi:hypothetical protein
VSVESPDPASWATGGGAWLAVVPLDAAGPTPVMLRFGHKSSACVTLPVDERTRSGGRPSPPYLGGMQELRFGTATDPGAW